jgi:hypothetical protein
MRGKEVLLHRCSCSDQLLGGRSLKKHFKQAAQILKALPEHLPIASKELSATILDGGRLVWKRELPTPSELTSPAATPTENSNKTASPGRLAFLFDFSDRIAGTAPQADSTPSISKKQSNQREEVPTPASVALPASVWLLTLATMEHEALISRETVAVWNSRCGLPADERKP